MAESKIGSAFVEVATKGLAKVQTDLNQIKARLNQTAKPVNVPIAVKGTEQAQAGLGRIAGFVRGGLSQAAALATSAFDKLGSTINGIGSIAAKGFFGATAAITGFVKMASPKEFDDFQFAIAAVAIQVGRIFLPLLREATAWLMRLRDFFAGLSNEQREAILHWVRIGLAIGGVLILLPRVMTAFRALQAAMAIFGAESAIATGGLTLLLGAIAAAVPLLIGLFGSMSGGEGTGGVFGRIGAALQRLWAVVSGVFSRIGDFIADVFDRLSPVIEAAIGVWTNLLGQIFQTVIPIVERVFAVIGGIVARIVPIFMRIVGAVERVFARVLAAFNQVLGPIMGLVETYLDTVQAVLLPVLETIGNAVGEIITAFEPVFSSLIATLVPVVQQLIGTFQRIMLAMRPVQETFGRVVRTIIATFIPIVQQAAAAWQSIIQELGPLFDALLAHFNEAVDAMTPAFEVVQVAVEALVPLFQMLANVISIAISTLAPMFRWLIQALVVVIQTTTAVLRPVFALLAELFKELARALRNGINTIIDLLNSFAEWYNSQAWLPGHMNRLARLGELTFGEGGGAGAAETPERDRGRAARRTDEDRFRGQVQQKAPELIGLAEVWKKFQTSQSEDLAARIAREQLNETRRTATAVETIAENTRRRSGWDTPGMEMA